MLPPPPPPQDKEKKAEVLSLLGPMPEEQYAMLVSLSKKITDYGSELPVLSGWREGRGRGREEGGEGGEGGEGRREGRREGRTVL